MKVCFVYSNRSEYSLLLPFIDYFNKFMSTQKSDIYSERKNLAKSNKEISRALIDCTKIKNYLGDFHVFTPLEIGLKKIL